jgi:sugar phosphate isomerase/epimerase
MKIESPLPKVSRRHFLGTAAAAAGIAFIAPPLSAAEALVKKMSLGQPNSVFDGVRIGCITYSYRGALNNAGEILRGLLQDGLSEVEMMGDPIQAFAGLRTPGRGRRGTAAEPAPNRPTDADREAQLAKCRDFRKLYNEAGINIHLEKIPFGQSDEEIDFNFLVAKALGCAGITTERNDAEAKRLAPFADKHKIWVGFHNHTNNFPSVDQPDSLLDFGEYIGFNLDVGHYFAGTKGKSPIPVLEKYHDRIVSLHLKDRTADGQNLPWGQGATPIKEILQLMRKEKWTFPADIEVEYKIPEGSNEIAEVRKCVEYCKEALA